MQMFLLFLWSLWGPRSLLTIHCIKNFLGLYLFAKILICMMLTCVSYWHKFHHNEWYHKKVLERWNLIIMIQLVIWATELYIICFPRHYTQPLMMIWRPPYFLLFQLMMDVSSVLTWSPVRICEACENETEVGFEQEANR